MKLTRAAAWATAGLLSAGTVFGITYTAFAANGNGTGNGAATSAAAATPSPDGGSGSAHAATPNRQGPKRHAGILARVEHGQFTARVKKGNEQFELQRGKVLAVSPTSIQVRSVDGFTATYAVTSSTKVRQDRKAASIGDVHPGDRVGVLANGAESALWIRDAGPAPARSQGQTQG